MTSRVLAIGAFSVFASLGFYLAQPAAESVTIEIPEATLPPALREECENNTSHTETYAFTFAQPFDARRELEFADSLEEQSEKLGRYLAIGHKAAKESPLKNLEALSPEIWKQPYYDLRGAFHAEWMRQDPPVFMEWAQAKRKELAERNELSLFPMYHLAYLEPEILFEALALVEDEAFLRSAKSNLVGTLLELDPELLWERRAEIATLQTLMNVAIAQGHPALAFDYWQRSGWTAATVGKEGIQYLAENSLLHFVPHLKPGERTAFAVAFAQASPAQAANWVRAQGELSELSHSFSPNHHPFFKELFSLDSFKEWSEASRWIAEAINTGGSADFAATIFSAIESCPKAAESPKLMADFRRYLFAIEDSEALKSLYLTLGADHPALATLEQQLLSDPSTFSDVLATRATRERPTPHRVLEALGSNNIKYWPDEYFLAARDALTDLSDSDLLWSLSPDMIINANQLDPERIQKLIGQSDPEWLHNSLNNPKFLDCVTIDHLETLPQLVQDLPHENAQHILENARIRVLSEVRFADDKTPYLALVRNSSEMAGLSKTLRVDQYLENRTLQSSIKAHPMKEDFLISLVAKDLGRTYEDPELSGASRKLKDTLQTLRDGEASLVSKIQSSPPEERFSFAKTTLLAAVHLIHVPDVAETLELPIWSDAEKDELQTLARQNRYLLNLTSTID